MIFVIALMIVAGLDLHWGWYIAVVVVEILEIWGED